MLSIYGVESWEYYHAYHIPNLAVPLWHLALFLSIYSRIARRESATSRIVWALACTLLVSTPIIVKIWSMEASAYLRFHMITLPAQVVACFLVYLSAIQNRRTRRPGNNLQFLMLGLGIMVGLQSLNFLQYFGQFQSFQSFSTFVPFIYMLALSTFVVGFWRYDPPGVSVDGVRMMKVEALFERSISILLRRLFEKT